MNFGFSSTSLAISGGLSYMGTWDASLNIPALASGIGTTGEYYVVSVAGNTNLDGISDWQIGDWAVFNGTAWQKIDNTGLTYSGVWDANTNTPTLTSSVGNEGHFYIVSVAGTTNLNGITDWQIGDWAIFTNGVWLKIDNSDTIGGSGTTNELPYWVSPTTLGSLSTTTYPSLTELSYVKGVTSAIQTQIDSKTDKNILLSTKLVSSVLALSDSGKLVEMNVGSANTLTIPASGTTNFPIGTQILISQLGAGQTQIVAALGVTLLSAGGKTKLTSQYSGASLIKRDTDTWYLFGDITT
ncbi:MAG: hypothetical protein ACOVOV_12630 [Dolichospermum sp.]